MSFLTQKLILEKIKPALWRMKNLIWPRYTTIIVQKKYGLFPTILA